MHAITILEGRPQCERVEINSRDDAQAVFGRRQSLVTRRQASFHGEWTKGLPSKRGFGSKKVT